MTVGIRQARTDHGHVTDRVRGGDSRRAGHVGLDPCCRRDEPSPANDCLDNVGVGHGQEATGAGVHPDEEGGQDDPDVLIHAEEVGRDLPTAHEVPRKQEDEGDHRHQGDHHLGRLAIDAGEGVRERQQLHGVQGLGKEGPDNEPLPCESCAAKKRDRGKKKKKGGQRQV